MSLPWLKTKLKYWSVSFRVLQNLKNGPCLIKTADAFDKKRPSFNQSVVLYLILSLTVAARNKNGIFRPFSCCYSQLFKLFYQQNLKCNLNKPKTMREHRSLVISWHPRILLFLIIFKKKTYSDKDPHWFPSLAKVLLQHPFFLHTVFQVVESCNKKCHQWGDLSTMAKVRLFAAITALCTWLFIINNQHNISKIIVNVRSYKII